MFQTSSVIAAKTGMGLAPGLTRLDVNDWRQCTLAPRVDALYVSTSARHPAVGEKAWRNVSRSPLFAIAREKMFEAMNCFWTFTRGKASCKAAMDIVSSATGISTPSVKILNRP